MAEQVPSSEATLASGLSARDATKPADAKPADTKPADTKPADAAKPAEGGEVKAMADRLAKLESERDARRERVEGEDKRDEFISAMAAAGEVIPKPLLRKMLPATRDLETIDEAYATLKGQLKEYVEAQVKAGFLAYVNVGGVRREGGAVDRGVGVAASASEKISSGLQSRR